MQPPPNYLHSSQPLSTPSQQAQPQPNPFSQRGPSCAAQLDYESGFPGIFLPGSAAEDTNNFRVELTSFTQSGPNGSVTTSPKRVIDTASALGDVLKDESIASATVSQASSAQSSGGVATSNQSRVTIITIPQNFSNGPLSITRTALKQLIHALDLPTTFLPILYAFGSVPRISESGLDCFTHIPDATNPGSFILTYLYRFKDRDSDEADSVWKDRQIGVLHRHHSTSRTTNEDLFIILQPHPNSMFDGGIEYEIQPNPEACQTLISNPFCLHQLLVSTYFDNWRVYFRDVADAYARSSAEAFSQDIVKDYSLEFDFLQRWRNTADNIVPIGAMLDSVSRIVRGLKDAESTCIRAGSVQPFPDFNVFAHSVLAQTEGLRHSALTLEKRIANIAELLTNTIEARNQMDAARLNRHMARLSTDTVDDSTSVKIITGLSLIYLPGSFVATLFGMNLFGFDQQNRQITVAKNFWLYVVIFLPLTMLTAACAWILSERARKRRDEREKHSA